jgi:hypothetical protein
MSGVLVTRASLHDAGILVKHVVIMGLIRSRGRYGYGSGGVRACRFMIRLSGIMHLKSRGREVLGSQ